MGSCKSNRGLLYDPVRQVWVLATPEEQVRQALLKQMVQRLGYSVALLSVEKEMSRLPCVQRCGVVAPHRKIDILAQQGERPLLLIECKRGPICSTALEQAWGYNAFIHAPFVALASERACYVFSYFDASRNAPCLYGLPSYAALCQAVERILPQSKR